MAKIELILPRMGESVEEATITNWLMEEGDKVEADDAVVEIATDKVDSEIASSHAGILLKKLVKSGDVVQVGQAVAIVQTDGEDEEPIEQEPAIEEEQEVLIEESIPNKTKADTIDSELSSSVDKKNINSNSDRFYSPLVKSIAKKEGISQHELDQIPGTGKDNRVTKQNILDYLSSERKIETNQKPVDSPIDSSSPVSRSLSGSSDIIEMDRMRKMIANHMVKSKQTSPHVTSVVEIDVTNLVNWRNKVKNEFEKREGFKITFTPLFIEAVAKAIKDFPMINVSVDGENIIVKKDINIGMAVALPTGNLIVPVVKGADQLNIIGLSKVVNDLSNKARHNKLQPDDVQGGTFTLTNIGSFGNIIGTPIINQPEAAIMAVGVIQKKPAVIESPEGDSIGIRQLMFISMSYDHRVVDGMLGGSFLRKVGDYLENADINRQIW